MKQSTMKRERNQAERDYWRRVMQMPHPFAKREDGRQKRLVAEITIRIVEETV